MKNQLYRVSSGLFGFVLGLLGNVLAGAFTSMDLVTSSVILLFGAGVLFVMYNQIRPARVQTRLKSPLSLQAESDKASYQRRGLIVFLSIYTPRNRSELQTQIAQIWQAIDQGHHAKLDFENSNFAPLITAITSHREKLQHCWIISTLPEDLDHSKLPNGSSLFVAPVIAHLQHNCGMGNCTFHAGAQYQMPMTEDSLKPERTRVLMTQVYTEAQKLGLNHHDLVADITSCTRDMVLGMILGCLQSDCDVQFVGTHYVNGIPQKGSLVPYVFPFEAKINE